MRDVGAGVLGRVEREGNPGFRAGKCARSVIERRDLPRTLAARRGGQENGNAAPFANQAGGLPVCQHCLADHRVRELEFVQTATSPNQSRHRGVVDGLDDLGIGQVQQGRDGVQLECILEDCGGREHLLGDVWQALEPLPDGLPQGQRHGMIAGWGYRWWSVGEHPAELDGKERIAGRFHQDAVELRVDIAAEQQANLFPVESSQLQVDDIGFLAEIAEGHAEWQMRCSRAGAVGANDR